MLRGSEVHASEYLKPGTESAFDGAWSDTDTHFTNLFIEDNQYPIFAGVFYRAIFAFLMRTGMDNNVLLLLPAVTYFFAAAAVLFYIEVIGKT